MKKLEHSWKALVHDGVSSKHSTLICSARCRCSLRSVLGFQGLCVLLFYMKQRPETFPGTQKYSQANVAQVRAGGLPLTAITY